MIWRFGCAAVAGYLSSRGLYCRTHGSGNGTSELPETFGLVVGGLIVLAAFAALYPDDERAHLALVAAFAAVGIGVGVHRLEMAVGQ